MGDKADLAEEAYEWLYSDKAVSGPKKLQNGAAFVAASIDPSCHMDAD